jgi:hypothetical protein
VRLRVSREKDNELHLVDAGGGTIRRPFNRTVAGKLAGGGRVDPTPWQKGSDANSVHMCARSFALSEDMGGSVLGRVLGHGSRRSNLCVGFDLDQCGGICGCDAVFRRLRFDAPQQR